MEILIGYIFVIISAIAKAVMDKVQFHYEMSIFARLNPYFWSPFHSWRNKWKEGKPLYGERFLGSTTIFVFLTDAWHLFQFIFLNSLVIGCFLVFRSNTFTNGIIHFIIINIVFRMTFEIFFKFLLNKK